MGAGELRYDNGEQEEEQVLRLRSVREQKIAEDTTVQKLCPRKAKSNWSELNKERCHRVERLGLMTDAGRAVLPDVSDDGFVILLFCKDDKKAHRLSKSKG